MSRSFDVTVVGAGPSGCACAIKLAEQGLSIALVHRAAKYAQVGDSLPPVVNRLLRELDVIEDFHADEHDPCYGNLSAWGDDQLESTDFIHDPDGHGWHVDRARFDEMLRRAAVARGAQLCVELPRARWMIDCTGRSSELARSRGVRRRSYDRLTATVGYFERSERSQDVEKLTVIEAVERGWWYTARTPGNSRVTMYFTDAVAARTPAEYVALLNATKHVRQRLSGYKLIGEPFVMPASSSSLEQVGGDRWIAAGDAACAHDPVASIGISAALSTGIRCADAVCRYLRGDWDAIHQYGRTLTSAFDRYRHDCASVYARERRWPDSQFWVDRSSGLFSRTIQSPVISSLK